MNININILNNLQVFYQHKKDNQIVHVAHHIILSNKMHTSLDGIFISYFEIIVEILFWVKTLQRQRISPEALMIEFYYIINV